MEGGVVAEISSNRLDRFVRVAEQFTGSPRSHVSLILLERHAGVVAEQAPKGWVAEAKICRDFLECQDAHTLFHQRAPRLLDQPDPALADQVTGLAKLGEQLQQQLLKMT